MPEFTREEEKMLANFVTNTNKDIFCIFNLPEVVKGALFSRYSRSTKSLRRVLLDEFILDKQVGFAELVNYQEQTGISKAVATKKAEEFYERVLVGFGDDSVAELAGAHVAIENISNIATKFIEDSRLGISPLEKSTRYIYFDQKINEKYPFYRDQTIMGSEFAEVYEQTCDALFDVYTKLIQKMSKFYEEKFHKEIGVSERAYASILRAKTCDTLRGILPASTLTNMGAFGNGRAFEYLLTKMYASDLEEINNIAKVLHNELRCIIPTFVQTTDGKYGKAYQEYISKTRECTISLVRKLIEDLRLTEDLKPTEDPKIIEGLNLKTAKIDPIFIHLPSVDLIDYDANGEQKVIAAIIYANSHISNSRISMRGALRIANSLSAEKKLELISVYVGERQNRRHKPYRAFENTYYTFDICANFGAYRDIHRHRVLTQERQLISTNFGYDIPEDIIDAGFEAEFNGAMSAAKNAYEIISKKMPKQAQYVVPLAYKIKWYMKMNLREAYHLSELRSVQQGHPDYRKIAHEIFKKIKEIHPNLANGMKFVDLKNYELERLEAEKKIDKKIQQNQ
ncbi:MAG: FAD-dependent thymidylate synthase [Candidatus Micrarchaeota archaeon]